MLLMNQIKQICGALFLSSALAACGGGGGGGGGVILGCLGGGFGVLGRKLWMDWIMLYDIIYYHIILSNTI